MQPYSQPDTRSSNSSYSQRVVFIKNGRVFTHLQRSDNQQQFFQNILNTLAQLEGTNELA